MTDVDTDGLALEQRRWAQRKRAPQYARTIPMNFVFGDGQNTISGTPYSIEGMIGFTGRLVLARIKADAVGSAAFTLTTGDYSVYPTLVDFTQGHNPTLSAAQKVDLSITAWKRYVRVQDEILCTLTSASGLKRVTLSLLFRYVPGGNIGLT